MKPLNLLIVFQVNCPGCFTHALPLASSLHHTDGDRLNILGLSTAFEDFDLNTADHTRLLLEQGKMIGATQLYFSHHGQQSYSVPIQFPVAFDWVGEGQAIVSDDDIDRLCCRSSAFQAMDMEAQALMRTRVQRRFQGRSPTAYTFSLNGFQGTPSWVLFDETATILAQWFGHKQRTDILALVNRFDPDS